MSKIVLMYHCVYCNDYGESGFQSGNAWQYKVNLTDFESQVKAVAEYCSRCKIDKNHIEFTFDDGGVSFSEYIAPILEKYGYKGVFYISTKYINTKGFLSSNQILELSKRGHIIGSHTHSHPVNIGKMSKEQILEEWIESIKILENITNTKIDRGSIPNGNGCSLVYEMAEKTGIKVLDTSIPAISIPNYNNMQIRGRFVIHNKTKVFDVIRLISNPNKRRVMYLKWWILSKIKRLLGERYDYVKSLWLNINKRKLHETLL